MLLVTQDNGSPVDEFNFHRPPERGDRLALAGEEPRFAIGEDGHAVSLRSDNRAQGDKFAPVGDGTPADTVLAEGTELAKVKRWHRRRG